MTRFVFFAALLLLWPATTVSSQTTITVLRFDKSTGVIDHGEDAAIRVGEIFEVNRYAGEFVYWVGRVEVYLVRPKIAGIKLLAKAENAEIQKGDVLELQRNDFDPLRDKLGEAAPANDSFVSPTPRAPMAGDKKTFSKTPNAQRRPPILFNFATGGLYSLPGASRSMGMDITLEIMNGSNRVIAEIDMSRSYTNGFALQAGLTLPLSTKLSVDLNYAYLPLRVRSATESQLLRYGLKGSASLAQINGAVNYRFAPNWQAGVGTGLYLPQVKVEGNRASTALSERQWGWLAALSHLLPLRPAVWLKSSLTYNVFLDNGPAIHFFALQTGLSFAMGR